MKSTHALVPLAVLLLGVTTADASSCVSQLPSSAKPGAYYNICASSCGSSNWKQGAYVSRSGAGSLADQCGCKQVINCTWIKKAAPVAKKSAPAPAPEIQAAVPQSPPEVHSYEQGKYQAKPAPALAPKSTAVAPEIPAQMSPPPHGSDFARVGAVTIPPTTEQSSSGDSSNSTTPTLTVPHLDNLKNYADGLNPPPQETPNAESTLSSNYQSDIQPFKINPALSNDDQGHLAQDNSANVTDTAAPNQQQGSPAAASTDKSATQSTSADQTAAATNTKSDSAGADCENPIAGAENCGGTKILITSTQATTAIGTIGTMAGTVYMGNKSVSEAAKNGSQAEAQRSAAKLAKFSGTSQLALGTATSVMGGMLFMRGKKHDYSATTGITQANQSKLEGLKQEEATAQNELKAARATNNQGTIAQAIEKRDTAVESRKDFERQLNNAKTEQRGWDDKAKTAGTASFIQGMKDVIGGVGAIMAAKEMEKAADNMRRHNDIKAPGFNMSSDPLSPRSPTAISGNGQGSGSAAGAEELTADNSEDDLPMPIGMDPPGGMGAAPPPAGEVLAKDNSPSNGGGGMGGGGVSTGAASGGGDTEAAPKMAGTGSMGEYANVGGGGGGGGAGRGGSGGSGMPDLGSMLAQFLPKEGADEDKPQNDILAFGRAPASDGSILGPNSKSLFMRISEVNSEKFKSGAIR